MSFLERASTFFNELPFNSNNDIFKYTMFMTKHSQVFKNMNTQFTAEDFEMFKEIINKLDYSTLCDVSSNLNTLNGSQPNHNHKHNNYKAKVNANQSPKQNQQKNKQQRNRSRNKKQSGENQQKQVVASSYNQ